MAQTKQKRKTKHPQGALKSQMQQALEVNEAKQRSTTTKQTMPTPPHSGGKPVCKLPVLVGDFSFVSSPSRSSLSTATTTA